MKVFITTSGIGSRLGKLTEFTNKSMVKLGQKPAISYIIEQYPEDFEFVITLGYFGKHIEQYLKIAYPNRKFTFVWVDKYEGPGTSQVYSQLQAKEYLQEPFIYNDCDTIVKNLADQIPMRDFDYNFLVGYKSISELYDSFDYDKTSRLPGKFESYKVTQMYRKTEFENAMLSYIGIAGVYDYKKFWEIFEKAYNEVDYKILNDTYVYIKYAPFTDLRTLIVDNWTDTGSISGVAKAREEFTDKLNVLNKTDQAIFIVGDKVIKFFAKDGMVDQIMTHYAAIDHLCPAIIDRTTNFFSYKFIDGTTAIKNIDSEEFRRIMNYYDEVGLWSSNDASANFKDCQYNFYIKRTIDRVNKFKQIYSITEDHDIVVNGITIPKEYTVEYMLDIIQQMPEWKNSGWTGWHGDFTLENIMKENITNTLYLIDCRQNYDKSLVAGDMIYDFAKMNMNLIFNFDSVYNNLYTVIENGNNIHVDIMVNSEAYNCRNVMKEFVEAKGISYNYIEILSGLVWLDLCPLFTDPLTKFLYYLGKYTMYVNIKKYENKH